ncbi:polysaccharide deacetylase family protein [Anaerorhabdus sp.]|uniref:polysaccharide deacetylase family protein n=1 Tax=Anaerorhabdus sp. TaxID=1872524 RepID=UPI002B200084|nr:polysaccharide deacetylase family protein [Anaerorhabdus sp.]MEA4873931.1 polysaccharide deacetylase family protein [Anaerorhabdus sp.]
MITKKTIKKKKVAIIVIMFAILCGISASILLAMNYVPEYLLEVKDHKEENVKLDAFKKVSNHLSIMVYYPKIDNELGNTIKEVSEKLYNQVLEDEADSEAKKILVRVDYTLLPITEELINYRFEITKLVDGIESTETESLWINKNDGNLIDTSLIYDDIALRLMTQSLRTQCKQDVDLQDVAYTKEFLEKTDKNGQLFTNFILDGNTLVYKIENLAPKVIEFRLDLTTIASHINIYFGVDQSIPDPVVYIPNRYVDPNRPMVALTFDDGPHITNTPQILEVLRRYDSAATFFVVGNRITTKGSAVILDEIESGSQVASHSYSHPNMAKMKNLDEQFYLTSQKVYEDVSQWCYQVTAFRPPYGAISKRMRETSPYPFIMWSIDTLDWKTRDVQSTINETMNNAKDGDIILLHDIHAESKDAAIQIIPMLIEKGFQVVTVNEMMSAKGIQMENGKSYSRAR